MIHACTDFNGAVLVVNARRHQLLGSWLSTQLSAQLTAQLSTLLQPVLEPCSDSTWIPHLGGLGKNGMDHVCPGEVAGKVPGEQVREHTRSKQQAKGVERVDKFGCGGD